MGAFKIDVLLNVFLTEHNNKTYLFVSACYVSCSKFNTKFDKMIKPIFSTNNSISSSSTIKSASSDESNLVEQLNSLNELYKSGVLTEEEFNKAKKKLLN